MRAFRAVLAMAAAFTMVVGGGGIASAEGGHVKATCAGTFNAPGIIAPGAYDSVKVTGFCLIPGGLVEVRHNLSVGSGAVLLANYPDFGFGEGDATLKVGGNVNVGNGGTLWLGCSPALGCNNITADLVAGNVIATKPIGLLFHSDTIGGNVSIRGGGGGVICPDPGSGAGIWPFGVYTTFEDTSIGGNYSVSGYQSCWLGLFRSTIGGDVRITNNTLADPDANEVATNTISGDLVCKGNSPAAQVGDSGGAPNVVGGEAKGECAGLVAPRI